MTDVGTGITILSFITAQRLAELVYARRNEVRLRARGAVEHAAEHYWLIVALHGAWLAGLWLTSIGRSPSLVWLVIFIVLQALRLWVLVTLKERWTTRIIVLPDAPLIADGPYRFMRHPNYAIVTAEILVLPMVFGLYAYGIAFTLANAGILAVRIRAENQALQKGSCAADRAEPKSMTHDIPLAQPAPSLAGWMGFIAMCVGMFMAILDIQIVATSLPEIQEAIGIRPDQMSWIQTSYLIAEVIAIPLTGWLTRVLSLRGLFVIATSVFVVASVACASSVGFASLISARVVQGFAGGVLIPIVFSAGFLLFPGRGQTLATTIAGALAVLAPTIGPVTGGWITSTYSWQWLFLINVGPGILAIAVGYLVLPRGEMRLGEARKLDLASLILIAAALAALEIGLKEAPRQGWASGVVLGLFLVAWTCGTAFVLRTLSRWSPVVDLRALADRDLALGCALSFVLGIGLYGSVYLMPVFLAYVRGHGALAIGATMLVTGAVQLIATPLVVGLERRVSARILTCCGFLMFATGFAMSAFETPRSDYDEMFWPQVVRGLAIMLCLLPPIRLALGHLPVERVPDASGLFNLMRNLGGAIGLALIDTVIFGRAEMHGRDLAARLASGDAAAFDFVGLPSLPVPMQIMPEKTQLVLRAVERAALTTAINEAWAMIGCIVLAGVLLALASRKRSRHHDRRH